MNQKAIDAAAKEYCDDKEHGPCQNCTATAAEIVQLYLAHGEEEYTHDADKYGKSLLEGCDVAASEATTPDQLVYTMLLRQLMRRIVRRIYEQSDPHPIFQALCSAMGFLSVATFEATPEYFTAEIKRFAEQWQESVTESKSALH
jgi:hypothetical protein